MLADSIALLGAQLRFPAWEERVYKIMKPGTIEMVTNPDALTKDVSACIYIVENVESVSVNLKKLIKRGIHVLVITSNLSKVNDVENMIKLNDESRLKIWFSHWSFFQPGISTIFERLPNPYYLSSRRIFDTFSDITGEKLKNIVFDECLFASKWLNSPIKETLLFGESESKLLLIRTQNGGIATCTLSHENNKKITERFCSGPLDAHYAVTKVGVDAAFITRGQKIPIQLLSDKTAADLLIESFFRDIKGLPVKPSFTLMDLHRYSPNIATNFLS